MRGFNVKNPLIFSLYNSFLCILVNIVESIFENLLLSFFFLHSCDILEKRFIRSFAFCCADLISLFSMSVKKVRASKKMTAHDATIGRLAATIEEAHDVSKESLTSPLQLV